MNIHVQFGFNNICSNAFFSETTNMIKAKLYMNVHWMVLYKLYVFCSDMKFKMAATAGPSLTLDPMDIGTKNVKFVEEHAMNIHVQFGFNNICSF
jgi:chemotaxis receptor (MCP) glutamine deamidase CheD